MTPPATVITASDALAQLRRRVRPVILDASLDLAAPRWDGDYRAVGGREAWLAERIPGSQHVDLLTEWIDRGAPFHFAAPSPAAFAEELGRAGIDGGRPVWLYDRGAIIWAARLWWTLRNAGIDAWVIDGGLPAWRDAGGPVTGGPAATEPPVAPPPVIDRGLWVDRATVEGVAAGTHPDRAVLVCALSADQMWGRVPTRYSRRGHIPGSVNLAAHDLVDASGSLLSLPARSGVAGAALLQPGREVIVYCGGGVSACLTALSLVHSGATHVRVYDGSLEEWSAVPELRLVSAG